MGNMNILMMISGWIICSSISESAILYLTKI
jgi:hypothetical protein